MFGFGKRKEDKVELKVLKIKGKKYFIVKEIIIEGVTYTYFAPVKTPGQNFLVLKTIVEDGEELFVSLDSDSEKDKAMAMFYEQVVLKKE